LQVLQQTNSLNLHHIAIRRACVLMKEVRQVLGKFFFGNEVWHDKLGRSTLAVRAKPKHRPTGFNGPDGNQCPVDFEVKFPHDFSMVACNPTATRFTRDISQMRLIRMTGIRPPSE
jgi:hypothetical protein